MAKYRMIRTEFWKNPLVMEEMTPEDKYFYLYLLTNPQTTQIGIYKITQKQMAFDLGYSIESVHSLMDRFIHHHQLIRYNPETRELAIKYWGKDNLDKGGKPVMDCIFSELKEVEDHSLIHYVAESIRKQEIRSLYESFLTQEETFLAKEDSGLDNNDTYRTKSNDTLPCRLTIRGQKENENEKEKEKQKQQEDLYPSIENKPCIDGALHRNQDVKAIIEFWDMNGFGITNVNAKEQLLSWLDDSRFIQPKEVILKAMTIACANNKRMLRYIVGILRNWENAALQTVAEIELYDEFHKPDRHTSQFSQSTPAERSFPSEFVFDPSAGEEE